jgi:hypothetical protein
MNKTRLLLFTTIFLIPLALYSQELFIDKNKEAVLEVFNSISSHDLYDHVKELTLDKYAGRLTGTEGYNKAAQWVADQLKAGGIEPKGDNNTYFQYFDIPYTLVFEDCHLMLHLESSGGEILKHYEYVTEFIPGSTSGSGEVTGEVIYAGYGISAPELDYDDYDGMDVKGKIVLIEREVPVSDRNDPERFKKWRPYSFHQYKLKNAVDHGAIGMLYNYGPIGNPNNDYFSDFIYTHVGDSVVKDIFSGTKFNHREVVRTIRNKLKPNSFSTGKTVTIKNTTKHFPDGKGSSVIGWIEGSDPKLKEEAIILGAHLDHLGACYEIMPGANDNASGVAVILEVMKALVRSDLPLKRSVVFAAFGAEEQAIFGSKVYLENPAVPIDKSVCLLNLDGVGNGTKLTAIAGKNYPEIWSVIDQVNSKYVHQSVRATNFPNLARPRLDAARFMWAGIPSISFSAYGTKSVYHVPQDDLSLITPEIMEDLAQILFLAVLELANE